MEISSNDEDSSCEIVEKSKTISEKLPTKSGKFYEASYNAFMKWREDNNINSFSEDTLLIYFKSLAEKYKSPSLWAHYSKLRGTLEVYHSVKLETYAKLRAFLKNRGAGYKAKKAKKFTFEEINGFIKYASDETYLATKVAAIMGVVGACRCNELKEMKITDLRDLNSAMLVNVPNRKALGVQNFILTGDFYEKVKKYISLRPPDTDCPDLFLSYRNGKCIHQRIGINKFSTMGKQIATFLKLPNPKMYNGLSFRCSSTTFFVDPDKPVKSHMNWQPHMTEIFSEADSIKNRLNSVEKSSSLNVPKTEEYTDYSIQSSSDSLLDIKSLKQEDFVLDKADEGYNDDSLEKNSEPIMEADNELDSLNSTDNCDSKGWSKELTVQFIEIYKSHPCLWKVKSRDYTDRSLKTKAYDKLVEFCKTINPQANREYVAKKIQSFRASFRKEYRKLKDSMRENSNKSLKVYTPRLWYFDLLLFTTDQEQSSSNSPFDDNVDDLEEDDSWIKKEMSECIVVEEDDEVRVKKEKPEDCEIIVENRTNSLENSSSINKQCNIVNSKNIFQKIDAINEYDAVAISWAEKMKRMNPTQAIYAEMLVNKIMAQGLLNQLTTSTDIMDVTTNLNFLTSVRQNSLDNIQSMVNSM